MSLAMPRFMTSSDPDGRPHPTRETIALQRPFGSLIIVGGCLLTVLQQCDHRAARTCDRSNQDSTRRTAAPPPTLADRFKPIDPVYLLTFVFFAGFGPSTCCANFGPVGDGPGPAPPPAGPSICRANFSAVMIFFSSVVSTKSLIFVIACGEGLISVTPGCAGSAANPAANAAKTREDFCDHCRRRSR